MTRIPDEAKLEDVEAALEAVDEAVYLYVGDERDEGWVAAQAAAETLAGLKLFRIDEKDRELVAHWLEADPLCEDHPVEDPSAVLFGYGDVPWLFLGWEEAQVPKKVLKWLRRADRET